MAIQRDDVEVESKAYTNHRANHALRNSAIFILYGSYWTNWRQRKPIAVIYWRTYFILLTGLWY